MDGKTFTKLCKDWGLLDKDFSDIDADLAFAKVVTKGQRRIGMSQFEALLRLLADKKGVEHNSVVVLVAQARRPVLLGTRPDAVRFHDDKSTYTGVYANGGPDRIAVGAGTVADQSAKRTH
jgi:hypothetical protein